MPRAAAGGGCLDRGAWGQGPAATPSRAIHKPRRSPAPAQDVPNEWLKELSAAQGAAAAELAEGAAVMQQDNGGGGSSF